MFTEANKVVNKSPVAGPPTKFLTAFKHKIRVAYQTVTANLPIASLYTLVTSIIIAIISLTIFTFVQAYLIL